MRRNTIALTLVALFFLAMASAWVTAPGGEKTKVKGMIIARTGETLIVKSGEQQVTVVLTARTYTKDNTGLFGLGRTQLASTVLIPGLKVSVDGRYDNQDRVVAATITVDGDDLEAAEMIQAGLHPTAEQVAANMVAIEANRQNIAANKEQLASHKEQMAGHEEQLGTHEQNIAANQQSIAAHKQKIEQSMKDIEENTNRFTSLADYETKAEATVKFAVGSSTISPKYHEELRKLAGTAHGTTGYIIEVTGFADSSGDAAMNTRLSENRAKAVITFLTQQGHLPIRHFVAPGAMGEYGPVTANENKAGRADNRRVEVKVLVNKGIAGI